MKLDGPSQTLHRAAAVVSDDDSVLLASAQRGDLTAFEGLVERYRDRVYAIALRTLGSEADAAEVSQETFLAAFRSLSEFRGDAALGSWLYRIASNFAFMRLRHRKVVAEVEQPLDSPSFNERGSLVDTIADWSPNAEGQALDAELGRAITQAASSLPEDYRRVFLLRDVDGLSYEEVAASTGETVPAIKSRLHRARLAMRAAIDRFYEERSA